MKFRSMIGSLQYLTTTQSDIAFPMVKISQFMQAHMVNHWNALKQILRYISATLYTTIHIKKSLSTTLQEFFDAYWGDLDDRKNQGTYVVYVEIYGLITNN